MAGLRTLGTGGFLLTIALVAHLWMFDGGAAAHAMTDHSVGISITLADSPHPTSHGCPSGMDACHATVPLDVLLLAVAIGLTGRRIRGGVPEQLGEWRSASAADSPERGPPPVLASAPVVLRE
jgi:hypothetical protein